MIIGRAVADFARSVGCRRDVGVDPVPGGAVYRAVAYGLAVVLLGSEESIGTRGAAPGGFAAIVADGLPGVAKSLRHALLLVSGVAEGVRGAGGAHSIGCFSLIRFHVCASAAIL